MSNISGNARFMTNLPKYRTTDCICRTSPMTVSGGARRHPAGTTLGEVNQNGFLYLFRCVWALIRKICQAVTAERSRLRRRGPQCGETEPDVPHRGVPAAAERAGHRTQRDTGGPCPLHQ